MRTPQDKELIEQLHSSVSAKGFEILIKDLLESIGFDDIEVTGRSGDSGIDLTATLRKSEIPGIDTSVSCIIQAKRFQPHRTLNPRIVRELRGSMQSGQRGIVITTCRVSSKTIEEEAMKDPSRIVLVIDGERLIELCRSKRIGVLERYVIDEEYLSKLEATEPEPEVEKTEIIGTKLVTENDIRARILRIPKEVKPLLTGQKAILIYWEDGSKQSLTIDQGGNYLGGVSAAYRQFGLIDANDIPREMFSEWEALGDHFLVRFKRAEYEERPDIIGTLSLMFDKKFTRLPNTSVFIGNGLKLLCRYSKRYMKDINYWYGITPKDIAMLKEQDISRLAFFCSTIMVAVIDRDDFLKQLNNLNTTLHENGEIRHYHIHLREHNHTVVWVLKGGATANITQVYTMASRKTE